MWPLWRHVKTIYTQIYAGTAEPGGPGGAHAPSIILPQLKFKEKKFRKETHLFCSWFCFRLLELLFYAKQLCFALRRTHVIQWHKDGISYSTTGYFQNFNGRRKTWMFFRHFESNWKCRFCSYNYDHWDDTDLCSDSRQTRNKCFWRTFVFNSKANKILA